MFDNRVRVDIEIQGEFLERRGYEVEGISKSKSYFTLLYCPRKEDISFHGKRQQVDASIHASRNLLDDEVTSVSTPGMKDDRNSVRSLIIKFAVVVCSATKSAGQVALVAHPYSAIQRLLSYVAVASIDKCFFLLWCKSHGFPIFDKQIHFLS